MSYTNKNTDVKDEHKSEHQYLTLADKKPSLIRETGNESSSARTISTRELSVNLQRTRDGLINLNRKKQGYDGLGRAHGSDSGDDRDENENFQGFMIPVRGKKSAGGMNGSSSSDITEGERKKFGQPGELGSGEFPHFNSNQEGGLSNEISRSINAQQGRRRGKNSLGSDMNSGTDQSGKHFKKKNDKLFKSQNQKKDGPLHTRIFIDAFLPSLESNRIFPLFNYRCAEKIERTSPEFYNRNRKGVNKQLAAVNSTEKSKNYVENDSRDSMTPTKPETVTKVNEFGNFEDIRELNKSGVQKQLNEVEKLEKITELGRLNMTEEHQELNINKVEKIHESQQKDDSPKLIELQGEELRKVNEMDGTSVLKVHETQEVDQLQAVLSPPNVTINNVHDEVVGSVSKERKSELDETKDGATEGEIRPSASAPTEEDKLLQRVLRTLLENEQLVDFFCEKVISKIAARNDFCGPNCKGKCGGLNKPSDEKEVVAD